MLFEDLERRAADRPSARALLADGVAWTYGELFEEALRVARAISAAAVVAGDRVALQTADVPQLVAAYAACSRLGVVAAPLSTRWPAAQLGPVLARLRPALHLGQVATDDVVTEAQASSGVRFPRVLLDGSDRGGAQTWAGFLARGDGHGLPRAAVDPDAPAVLLSTSGTTGTTKLVVHTVRTLEAATEAVTRGPVQVETLALDAPPMLHAGSFTFLLGRVHLGVPVALVSAPATAATALDTVEAHGCTYVGGLPTLAITMVAEQRERPRRIGSLRHALSGGDVLPAGFQEEFEAVMGVPLMSLWSSTEVLAGVSVGDRPGPFATVLAGTEVRVVDDAGSEVVDGDQGELLVRGPAVSPGYWVGPGRVEDGRVDGWFATGDVFERAGDGLRFVARRKELIVTGGSNVAPAEVEQVLLEHPGVADAVVLGVGDDVLGQRPVALVVARAVAVADTNTDTDTDDQRAAGSDGTPGTDSTGGAGSAVLTADLLRFARERVAAHMVPTEVVVVDAVPRTALGVDRQAAAASFARRRPGSPSGAR